MGFLFPANDYIERRLVRNELMVSRPAATLFVPTTGGIALVDKFIRPKRGDTIEGEALDEVTVIGVQTWGVISAHEEIRLKI